MTKAEFLMKLEDRMSKRATAFGFAHSSFVIL